MNMDDPENVTYKDFAEAVISLKGEALTLNKYAPMHQFYGDPSREILLMAGRQVSKSTSVMIRMIMKSILKRFYAMLYVVPLKDQSSRFSNLYIGDTIKFSPVIQKFFLKRSGEETKNVHTRTFANGSVMHFQYCFNSADRVRGISVDECILDEVQDMLSDIVPIIFSCMKASRFRRKMYCGTPKTFDNTIEGIWKNSTKYEWAMKCSACGFWSIPNDQYIEKMINPYADAGYGVICPRSKCQKPLDITRGQWISTGNAESRVKGYHLPQIIFPHNMIDPVGWEDFKGDYIGGINDDPSVNFTRRQVFNEMFGLSYDIGGRIITQQELEACCDESCAWFEDYTAVSKAGMVHTFGGVDWGVGGDRSFTVIAILGLDSRGRSRLVYAKKFPGGDPLKQLEEITIIFRKFRVARLGADYGNGYVYNQILRRNLGIDKVFVYQYVSSRAFVAFNATGGHYTVDRTNIINLTLLEMKQHRYIFPKLAIAQNFFDDILSVYEEEVQTPTGSRKVFRHSHDHPDDYLHAHIYAALAQKFHMGDPTINLQNITQVYQTESEVQAGTTAPVDVTSEDFYY